MNSLTHPRHEIEHQQPAGAAAVPAVQEAGAAVTPPAHPPAQTAHTSRWYVALLVGALALILLGVVLAARIGTAPTTAGVTAGGGIIAENVWARAASRPVEGSGGTSAVYLRIQNQGGEPDQLIGATSDASVTTEVHRTLVEDGVMRMRPAGPVEVPAGGAVMLQPGGLHIMLIDLKQDLVAGERLAVTLHFARAGDLLVDAEVRAPMPAPMHGR